MFALAALVIVSTFWGLMGLVWYLEGFAMAVGVALPFMVLYKLGSRWLDGGITGSEAGDPSLNAFQQPLSPQPRSPKLPG